MMKYIETGYGLWSLDYKALLETESPLTLLEPLLRDGNVYVVAKMAPNINLTPSSVFRTYCTNLLWKGEGKTQKQSYENRWERIERYRNQMESSDWLDFVAEVTCSFNPDLPYTLREKVSHEIPLLKSHIGRLSDLYEDIKDTYILPAYLDCYIHTNEAHSIRSSILLATCFDDILYHHLKDVLQLFEIEKSPKQVVEECVEYIVRRISEVQETAVVDTSAELHWYTNEHGIALLEKFIENSKTSGDVYIGHEDIISIVKAVCNESTLQSATVNSLVAVLEKYLNTKDDAVMIVYYKTNSITSKSWNLNISMTDILKHHLISRLCDESNTLDQFKDLVEIIKLWSTVELAPQWITTYLSTVARSSLGVENCSKLITDLMSIDDKALSPSEVTSIAELFREPSLSYLLILMSSHSDLYYNVPTEITARDLDNELLLDVVITREVYLDMVGTDLWSIIVRKIVSTESMSYVFEVSKKVQEMGYILEAASLLAHFTASKYTTFSSYKVFLTRR